MKTIRLALGALSFILLLGIGCSRYGNELQYVEYGTIDVQLTDAPFPYDNVAETNITVVKIDGRLKDDALEGESFHEIFTGEVIVNLLELTNGVTHTLEGLDIPVGTYDLVRLYVSDASMTLTDGTVYDVKVPSGEQTGLKVFVTPGIQVATQLTSDLLLDIDISRSFIPLGNPNSPQGITGFNFKPVVRAANLTVTGTLSGTVLGMDNNMEIPLEGATVTVMENGTEIASTFTDKDGGYTFLGLNEGSYSISVVMDSYTEQTLEGLEIIKGNRTTQNVTLVKS